MKLALLLAALAAPLAAQSLTPEEIARMLDEQAATPNPYATLLNDPDPARSMGAMRIMMESGDAQLVRLATEFGLLSPDPVVRRTAFEALLATGPTLTVRVDGTDVEDKDFTKSMRATWQGTVDPDAIAYIPFRIGAYDAEQNCFLSALEWRSGPCFVTVNADGIFFRLETYMSARGEIDDTGTVVATASFYAIDDPVPITIRLID